MIDEELPQPRTKTVFLPHRLTFSDGVKFGCGFFAAAVLFSIIMGVVSMLFWIIGGAALLLGAS